MISGIRETVDLILKDAVEDWSYVGWAFGLVNSARGVPPDELDPPDYLLATLRILLERGLITVGAWEGNAYQPWSTPIEVSIRRIQEQLKGLTHKPNHGEVADVVATAAGEQAYQGQSAILDEVTEQIGTAWGEIDARCEGDG